MLNYLITSKTRIKLLLKFFLNTEASGYLRSLAEEFGESTNAVRVELNRLTEAGLLETTNLGRTKLYQANKRHSLFNDLHSIVKKYIGIDQLIEDILVKLGNVEVAFITGDYAKGVDSGTIDLVIVGDIDKSYLFELINKVENMIHRKISAVVLNRCQLNNIKESFSKENTLVIWHDKK